VRDQDGAAINRLLVIDCVFHAIAHQPDTAVCSPLPRLIIIRLWPNTRRTFSKWLAREQSTATMN
jgi:hypothetical protein